MLAQRAMSNGYRARISPVTQAYGHRQHSQFIVFSRCTAAQARSAPNVALRPCAKGGWVLLCLPCTRSHLDPHTTCSSWILSTTSRSCTGPSRWHPPSPWPSTVHPFLPPMSDLTLVTLLSRNPRRSRAQHFLRRSHQPHNGPQHHPCILTAHPTHPGGVFAQRQLLRVYPGNTPANHPPTEGCMIHSKQHRGCRIQDPGTRGYRWGENSRIFAQCTVPPPVLPLPPLHPEPLP